MRHLITLLILCCAALTAADPVVASNAALTQAKAEQEYRAYLTALAKAYQTETAKFEAQLKRDATAVKKDPDALATITALQEKVKEGKQLADLRELIDGKLLSGDAVAVEKIVGSTDQLIGKWTIAEAQNLGYHDAALEIKTRRVVRLILTSVFTNAIGHPDATDDIRYMKWIDTDNTAVFDALDERGGTSVRIEVSLPLPMTGDTLPAKFIIKSQGKEYPNAIHLVRVPDAPAAK